ncbi:hypothetical protein ACFQL4_24505 [Halosimplex aquaticum]
MYLQDGESAEIWTGALAGKNDLSGTAFDLGVRYQVDGQRNSTVFTDVVGSPNVDDVQIEHEADGDVNLVVYADRELDTIEFDLGGDLSGVADGIDHVTSVGPNRHRHELNVVGTLSSGIVKANLTTAEVGTIPAYETQGSRSINRSISILSGDYVWQSAGDWDAASVSDGVVHDSFGDRRADRVALGYPAEDQFGSGLAGYWPLDGSGDDASGSGLSGTLENGPSSGLGVHGTSSVRFDGTDDYVDVGTGLGDIHSGTSSLSAWVQTSSSGSSTCGSRPVSWVSRRTAVATTSSGDG